MKQWEIFEKFQNWHDLVINFQEWSEKCDDSLVNIHY